MTKKNPPATKSDPQSNATWIMKSKCRCGQCELDISWKSTTSLTNDTSSTTGSIISVQPNDTYTWDCYCSKCRIYHGSVFTSYVQVSKEQIQIRKQSRMQYYRHTCDEIDLPSSSSSSSSSSPNRTTIVERIFCSKCYCKLATTATTTTTTTTISAVNSITNTTTNSSNTNITPPNTATTEQLWYINMGCIVDKTIRTDFAQHWRNHRIPKQISQSVSWYPAQPKYPITENSSSNDEDDDDDECEEENDNDEEVDVKNSGEDENNDDNNDEGTSSDHDNSSNDDNSNHDSNSNNDDNDDADDDDENRHSITTQPQTPLRGGCACGRVQYQINQGTIDIPNELPICYCRLCRQMSGTAFVPWIYITSTKNNFQWKIAPNHKKALKLLRTTSFGKRHICTHCGVVLTIVYDEEKKEYIWPTAASIYDPLFPYNSRATNDGDICRINNNTDNNKIHPIHNGLLQSVRHIYCQDNAIWYQIPKDGLPRSYNNND